MSSDHPLAKYQQQLDASHLEDINDLAVVRAMTQANLKLSTSQITAAINGILASSNIRTVLQLALPDLIVEEGATMVLAGPITTLTAANVVVLGEILAYGSLSLSCSTLGGIAPPVMSSISPPSGSTLGGTEVVIQGSGLDSTVAIYFGNTPATQVDVDVEDSGVCTAWAPPAANAGPVDITARAYGVLTSSTSPADIFTYVYLPGVSGVDVSSRYIWAGESATGTVISNEPAPAGGTTVTLSITSGPTGVTVPASVFINPGDTSATFPITASATATAGESVISVTGPDGTSQSAVVTIYAGEIFMTHPPGFLVSGQTAAFTVFVRAPAPASGGLVTLSTSDPGAVSIPANVPLPAGSTSATFTITGLQVPPDSVTPVTVSATYAGNSSTSDFFDVIRYPPHLPPPPPPPKNGGNPA